MVSPLEGIIECLPCPIMDLWISSLDSTEVTSGLEGLGEGGTGWVMAPSEGGRDNTSLWALRQAFPGPLCSSPSMIGWGGYAGFLMRETDGEALWKI